MQQQRSPEKCRRSRRRSRNWSAWPECIIVVVFVFSIVAVLYVNVAEAGSVVMAEASSSQPHVLSKNAMFNVQTNEIAGDHRDRHDQKQDHHHLSRPRIVLADETGAEAEDEVEDEVNEVQMKMEITESEMQRIQDLVMRGLNISKIPQPSEINISQREYEEKYRLYLDRLNRANGVHAVAAAGPDYAETDYAVVGSPSAAAFGGDVETTHIHTFRQNLSRSISNSVYSRSRRSLPHKDLVFVQFPLPTDEKWTFGIEEATLRLLLYRHPHPHPRHVNHAGHVNVLVYQLTGTRGRILLDKLEVPLTTIARHGKWVEFNVRSAVASWIEEDRANLGFEIHCSGCEKEGVEIIHEQSNVAHSELQAFEEDHQYQDETSPVHSNGVHGEENMPALNIISKSKTNRGKRSRMVRPNNHNRLHSRRPHHTKCEEHNGQKCCRSEMVIVFQELKALDFIIQPKSFDAGHCRGKCPFNYNVASNHAYLQGMVWRQDKRKVPRPCCAPKKLEDLQVLHIDEQDPTKLKVSTWVEMRVLECACS